MKLGRQEIADGLAVARHERRNVDKPRDPVGAAVGKLRDDGTTETVTDERDPLRVRRLQGCFGGGHVVRKGDTADVLERVGMCGQGGREYAMAACLEVEFAPPTTTAESTRRRRDAVGSSSVLGS